MNSKIPRRSLFVLTGAGAASLALAACGKGPPSSCMDVSSLSPDDKAARGALSYLDKSTDPAKECTKCQQWVAPASIDQCGTCKVVKGPIHPNGTCKSFLAK
jgi:hypothetical protein